MLRQYRKDALIVFCFLAFFYAYFYHDAGTNGNSRYSLIFAFVRDRHLYIDDYYRRYGSQTGDIAYLNGHYYSDKAIGLTVIGAIVYEPFYWMKRISNHPSMDPTKIAMTFLVIGLPSAVAGSLMYILCFIWSKSRFRAFLVTMTITLGTMCFPYSSVFFSHQLTASLLFCAFVMIVLLKEMPEITRNGYLFLIGLLLGWALISEYPTALIILAMVVYYFSIVWRNPAFRHWRSLGWPMIGGAIPVLLMLVYNKLCFNNFFSIGYKNLVDPYFQSEMAKGLMGIQWPNLRILFYTTLHPMMGIFWQSPALLLAIIGAIYMIWKRIYREEAILATWMIGSYLVIMSGYFLWWGGGSLGPRHLIPILPFFCVLLTFIPKRLNWLFVVLSLASIGQMIIATASEFLGTGSIALKIGTMGFFDYSIIYNYCLKSLIAGTFAHNWGNEFLNLHSWSILIPLVVALAGIAIYFIWNPGEKTRILPNQG